MGMILSYKYTLLYVGIIPIIGWIFVNTNMLVFPDGSMLSPAAFLVGLVFVLRDFAQREIGHRVIYAMLIATGINFVLADPAIAIAGAVAFLFSEVIDWVVYTYTKVSLANRILLSSLVAVPVDSLIVLYGLSFTFPGAFTFGNVIVLTFTKLIVACLVAGFVTQKK